jgi:hypothetical protein
MKLAAIATFWALAVSPPNETAAHGREPVAAAMIATMANQAGR